MKNRNSDFIFCQYKLSIVWGIWPGEDMTSFDDRKVSSMDNYIYTHDKIFSKKHVKRLWLELKKRYAWYKIWIKFSLQRPLYYNVNSIDYYTNTTLHLNYNQRTVVNFTWQLGKYAKFQQSQNLTFIQFWKSY